MNISAISISAFLALACTQSGAGTETIHVEKQSKIKAESNDEKDFYSLLTLFKKEVSTNHTKGLIQLMNFPFYTSKVQLSNGTTGAVTDPIDQNNFSTYQKDIYNPDVVKLLPKSNKENLSEVGADNNEPYYQSIKKITDKGSKLYELYIQYPESNSEAESNFAFVFGRINGKYKVVAYYAKWPVK